MLPKCVYCTQSIPDKVYHYSSLTYHPKCFDDLEAAFRRNADKLPVTAIANLLPRIPTIDQKSLR